MTMAPRLEMAQPQTAPTAPTPAATDPWGQPMDRPQTADQNRTFAAEDAPAQARRDEGGLRPQADFGSPISLAPDEGSGEPADAEHEPTQTGGDMGETSEPHSPEPRTPEPLTVRIHQGLPSYSEPDPDIAGVVGRAAPRGQDDPHVDGPAATRPREGGTP
ncbi:MAG: hypothetical protein DI570_16680 [Phenylobacterium zucineum]|nr:MAG: hypothetical protein DI570_16680 [Phenylobacterium zucineum]